MLGPVGLSMLEKLGLALAPVAIRLEDESHRHAGHAGARPDGESHFAVSIASAAFLGKRPLERHRMVNAALAQELKARVHALAINASAPEAGREIVKIYPDDKRLAALLAESGLGADDLKTPQCHFFGLVEADRLLACGGIELVGDLALLRSLAVTRELRGQGYGQAMALRLMSEARSHGAREIWLLTETTRDFFAGLGFVEASRAEAPPALQATSQFAGSRCRAAAAMRRPL